MAVLTCPVCRGRMREVAHLGIHIDTCTQCRGVWLDRGELEKLGAALQQEVAPQPARAGPASWRRDDDDDWDDDDRGRAAGRPPQKKGMSRFLDFFD